MRLKWQDGHDGQSIVLGRPVWTRLGRIWRMGVSVPGWVGSRRTRVSAKSLRWIKIPKQLKIHSVRGGAWNNSRILMDGIGLGCAECKHMPKKEHLRPFRICLSQVSSQDHRISTHVSLAPNLRELPSVFSPKRFGPLWVDAEVSCPGCTEETQFSHVGP